MSEQEKFQPRIKSADTSEKILSKEDYLRQALENLQITSRTAKGVVDISASPDKAREIQDISEREAADRATANFEEVIKQLYEQRDRKFENPEELQTFIEDIALRINKGITKEDVLVRSHDSDKYPYTKVENLSQEMKQFYEELFARLQNPSEDPESLAGWIEYRLDLTDHFFADGCSKTAKAISSWALMRSGHKLPQYRSREELYQHAPTQIRGTNPEANQKEFELWMEYYKSLFESPESEKTPEYTNGEEMLLAVSPVFKRRYIHDGDLMLGCRYGCEFCYYRWISASKDYIGTEKLKRLATPEQMVEFLRNSKLFLPKDVLILGARGDASMYPKEVLEFLDLIKDDEQFKDNITLALHRGPASELMKKALLEHPNFRFGTTITPKAYELKWTKVKEEAQITGLKRLLEAGVEPDRISIEIGPLNSENIDEGMGILQQLEEMGFRNIMVRGVAFGTFGVDREKELKKMVDLGFIDPSLLESPEKHEYYVVKNFLTPDAYKKLQEMVPKIKIHRHTYTYYRDVWKVPIALNRKNEVRISEPTIHSGDEVKRVVEKYGLKTENVSKKDDHYFIELPNDQVATEDIAMTIGAELESAVIFNNYRRTASLEDVKFYQENSLFYLDSYLKEK
jgi:hypothetical protein